MASHRSRLSEHEQWLDLFLDSIVEPAAAWWNDDNESDGLSNLEEFSGTNPFASDTDGDGLTDGNETNGTAYNGMLVKTNPLLKDTDGDGRTDYAEFYEGNQTHALLADTDGRTLRWGKKSILVLTLYQLIERIHRRYHLRAAGGEWQLCWSWKLTRFSCCPGFLHCHSTFRCFLSLCLSL